MAASPSLPSPASRMASARSEKILPDSQTAVDMPTDFNATFNPTVAPYKRYDVKDALARDFSLVVADPSPVPIPIHQVTGSNRDQFSASIIVLAQKGISIPIPSVSARSRLLSYVVRPPARVRFYKDSAENWTVKIPHDGRFRIDFLVNAPRSYFNSPVPLQWPSNRNLFAQKKVPAAVRDWAQTMLTWLGITRRQTLRSSLNKLVGYLRSFTLGPVIQASGRRELLTKMFLSRRGVCRHRAYLMTLLAQSLGLPARYVTNETHAFTEIYLPKTGWRRVDLGGASPHIAIRNAEGKQAHRVSSPDPFPSPQNHLGNEQNPGRPMEESGSSRFKEVLQDSSEPGRNTPHKKAETMDGTEPFSDPRRSRSKEKTGASIQDPGALEPPWPPVEKNLSSEPVKDASLNENWTKLWKELKWKGPLKIMSRAPSIVMRGGVIVMSGDVDGENADKVIRLEILLNSLNGTRHLSLGYAEIGPNRTFSIRLPIPRNLPPGRYWLRAVPIKK